MIGNSNLTTHMARNLCYEDSPGGGHGNPLQCYCLENPHGQRNLAGYSPWVAEEDQTEQPSTSQMARKQ